MGLLLFLSIRQNISSKEAGMSQKIDTSPICMIHKTKNCFFNLLHPWLVKRFRVVLRIYLNKSNRKRPPNLSSN